jgi:transposase-like protein
MTILEIKSELLKLPLSDRQLLLSEIRLKDKDMRDAYSCQELRRESLNNKQGVCPHCGNNKYVKFGFKSNSQRYKCKSCNRSFTEYSGTWMAGIHSKDKIDDYLDLMMEQKSLDKIKVALSINKKTAFDWRHKVLASLSDTDKDDFTGITESDETFFLNSEKGRTVKHRASRKRGGTSKTRGISNDQVAVIVTQDRKSGLDLTVATLGRLKKVDIENAIGSRIKADQIILCSDAHVSYKGFAIDNQIEHHPLKSVIKQRVKNKIYHIQHVNSTHNRIKKWIDNTFWGVSTKYLQQYLNWYRVKEMLKNRNDKLKAFTQKVTEDITAYQKYKEIDFSYEKLISILN